MAPLLLYLTAFLTVVAANPAPVPADPPALQVGQNTIKLHARPRQRIFRRQTEVPNTLPLKDAWNGTDLQWYGSVQIGTPPQEFQMCFDTGSPDIIFPSVSCTAAAGCVKGVKFDQAKSSTFKSRNRPWTESFATGVGVDPLDHPYASGIVATDTVTLAGLTVEQQAIGPMTKRSAGLFHDTEIEGIFGLSPGGVGVLGGRTFFANLLSQKKLKQPLFSMFMTPRAVGNAELTLGGVDPAKFQPPIAWVPVNLRSGAWNITFQGVTVGGKTIATPKRWAIADSGTSNMYAPVADTLAIYAAISPSIKQIDPKGAYGLPCSQAKQLNKTLDIQMSGVRFTIPSNELSVGEYKGQPGICQMLINTDPSVPFWIIGGSLMKYYYTIWDVGNSRLGWARTAHSPTT